MSITVPDQALAVDVRFTDDQLVVRLEDGRELGVPLEWFATLRSATVEQRTNWRLIAGGEGIHWPDLDEDLLVQALLVPSASRALDREASSPVPDEELGDETSPANGSAGGAVEWRS